MLAQPPSLDMLFAPSFDPIKAGVSGAGESVSPRAACLRATRAQGYNAARFLG